MSRWTDFIPIRLQDGDVLFVRSSRCLTGAEADRAREALHSLLEATGLDIHIVVVDSDVSIERLDEARMRELGWVRERGGA